jgi:hypothetical protein
LVCEFRGCENPEFPTVGRSNALLPYTFGTGDFVMDERTREPYNIGHNSMTVEIRRLGIPKRRISTVIPLIKHSNMLAGLSLDNFFMFFHKGNRGIMAS